MSMSASLACAAWRFAALHKVGDQITLTPRLSTDQTEQ